MPLTNVVGVRDLMQISYRLLLDANNCSLRDRQSGLFRLQLTEVLRQSKLKFVELPRLLWHTVEYEGGLYACPRFVRVAFVCYPAEIAVAKKKGHYEHEKLGLASPVLFAYI